MVVVNPAHSGGGAGDGATDLVAAANEGVSIVGVLDPELRELFFSQPMLAEADDLAQKLGGHLRWFDSVEDFNAALRGGEDFPDASALITTWGMPRLEGAVLGAFPQLRIVAHTGASVKFLVSEELFDQAILVTESGDAMARPVAEVALTFTLALLHQIHRLDHAGHGVGTETNSVLWEMGARSQREILGAQIGVVGASRTGRSYINLVQALGAEVSLYDPTVGSEEARRLNVRLKSLPELMATSQVVSVHAPTLPETFHMIDQEMLELMPEGAGLTNTARSWVVDEAALVRLLQTGKIDAALDVYDEEPLPADHPLRTLPNVLMTPHTAAGTLDGRRRAGRIVIEEIRRFVENRDLEHAVPLNQLATRA